MIRKHVRARQQRNRELGKRDAANRCGFCRKALPKQGAITRWDDDRKRYCDNDCLEIALENEARR